MSEKPKRKNDEVFNPLARSHRVLDHAIDQLREALHFQLVVNSKFHNNECSLDAVVQAADLITVLNEQIRMVISDPNIQNQINMRKQEKAIEYQVMMRRYGMNELMAAVDISTTLTAPVANLQQAAAALADEETHEP